MDAALLFLRQGDVVRRGGRFGLRGFAGAAGERCNDKSQAQASERSPPHPSPLPQTKSRLGKRGPKAWAFGTWLRATCLSPSPQSSLGGEGWGEGAAGFTSHHRFFARFLLCHQPPPSA